MTETTAGTAAAPDLVGRLVEVAAIHEGDAPGLLPSASDPEVRRWKLVRRPETVGDMRRVIGEPLQGPGRQSDAVRRRSEGVLIGSTTLGHLDLRHRRVEMGFTWLDRRAWGQGFNEDVRHVVLRHCFEAMGLHRVELQVDADNVRSRRALERFGLVCEGSLRGRHLRPDGTWRDSLFFGIVEDEWPAVAGRLQDLIDERSGVSGGR